LWCDALGLALIQTMLVFLESQRLWTTILLLDLLVLAC
jgi:hypothetical protein